MKQNTALSFAFAMLTFFGAGCATVDQTPKFITFTVGSNPPGADVEYIAPGQEPKYVGKTPVTFTEPDIPYALDGGGYRVRPSYRLSLNGYETHSYSFLAADSIMLGETLTGYSMTRNLRRAYSDDDLKKADYGPKPNLESAKTAIAKSVGATLRDPDSAVFKFGEFEKMHIPTGDDGTLWFGWGLMLSCNAKNGLGGYAGPELYFATIRSNTIFKVEKYYGQYETARKKQESLK